MVQGRSGHLARPSVLCPGIYGGQYPYRQYRADQDRQEDKDERRKRKRLKNRLCRVLFMAGIVAPPTGLAWGQMAVINRVQSPVDPSLPHKCSQFCFDEVIVAQRALSWRALRTRVDCVPPTSTQAGRAGAVSARNVSGIGNLRVAR